MLSLFNKSSWKKFNVTHTSPATIPGDLACHMCLLQTHTCKVCRLLFFFFLFLLPLTLNVYLEQWVRSHCRQKKKRHMLTFLCPFVTHIWFCVGQNIFFQIRFRSLSFLSLFLLSFVIRFGFQTSIWFPKIFKWRCHCLWKCQNYK